MYCMRDQNEFDDFRICNISSKMCITNKPGLCFVSVNEDDPARWVESGNLSKVLFSSVAKSGEYQRGFLF